MVVVGSYDVSLVGFDRRGVDILFVCPLRIRFDADYSPFVTRGDVVSISQLDNYVRDASFFGGVDLLVRRRSHFFATCCVCMFLLPYALGILTLEVAKVLRQRRQEWCP